MKLETFGNDIIRIDVIIKVLCCTFRVFLNFSRSRTAPLIIDVRIFGAFVGKCERNKYQQEEHKEEKHFFIYFDHSRLEL
jgi:hypothetical protein